MNPDPLPPWTLRAAETLYDRKEAIDDEAMDRAQFEQDPEAGRDTWLRLVAGIIAGAADAERERRARR